jgi:hypothetical protein
MADDVVRQEHGNGSKGKQINTTPTQASEMHESSARPEHDQEQREGGARRLLQEAIRKVMEEIKHHENEARKHMHQAAELRKDLGESIAFLQEQGDKGQRLSVAKSTRSDKAAIVPKEDTTGALPSTGRKRSRGKRK